MSEQPQSRKGKEMSKEEALEFLDLPITANAEDIRVRYKQLAKKLHPDIKGGSDKEFKKLQEASTVALTSKGATPTLSYDKEYKDLKSRVTPFTEDEEELEQAEIHLTKEATEDFDKTKKLELARARIQEENARAIEVARKYAKRSRERVTWTPADYEKEEKIKQQSRERFHKDLKKVFIKPIHQGIKHIIKTHKIRDNKAHIPIEDTINGKKITRYVVLTTALLSAIIAGKYVYDYTKDAFTPKKFGGLLTHKKIGG